MPLGDLIADALQLCVHFLDPPVSRGSSIPENAKAGKFDSLGVAFLALWIGCLQVILDKGQDAPEFDYSSFYAKTGARDPLLFGGSRAFLMTRLRTGAHEETELLNVLKIPFRVRTS